MEDYMSITKFPILFAILVGLRKVKTDSGQILVDILGLAQALTPNEKFNNPYNHARRLLLSRHGIDLRAVMSKEKAKLEGDKRIRVFQGVPLNIAILFVMLHESAIAAQIRAEITTAITGDELFPELVAVETKPGDPSDFENVDVSDFENAEDVLDIDEGVDIDIDDDSESFDDESDEPDESDNENMLAGLGGTTGGGWI